MSEIEVQNNPIYPAAETVISAIAPGLPKGRPAMSAKFDRSRIMKEAHFLARWRVLTVGGSYREWFAKTLAAEWKRAKERAARREWNKATVLESSLGLPLRSCPADATPRAGAFAGVTPAARLFTRESGRIAGAFAA